MTQEEKKLLLNDICTRLPYGLKCQIQEDEDIYIGTLCKIEVDDKNGHLLDFTEPISGLNCQVYLSEIKPYLFPFSSMTKEQTIEYCDLQAKFLYSSQYPVTDSYELFEWLNKNCIDYRGLIEKGLAINATGLEIY